MQNNLWLTTRSATTIDSILGALVLDGAVNTDPIQAEGAMRAFRSDGQRWMATSMGQRSLLFATRYKSYNFGSNQPELSLLRRALNTLGETELQVAVNNEDFWAGGHPMLRPQSFRQDAPAAPRSRESIDRARRERESPSRSADLAGPEHNAFAVFEHYLRTNLPTLDSSSRGPSFGHRRGFTL